jgi:DNA invertase Pin-like site-specific DNA recombinase
MAAALGYDVARVYSDVDLSAFDRKVRRPDYEAMMDSVRRREIDGVLVWKMDRLLRQSRELEGVLDTLEDAGAFLKAVHDPVDTTNSYGRAALRMFTAMDQAASESTSLRGRRKAEELARAGRPGTGIRAFGTTALRDADGKTTRPYTLVIVPDEAEAIRDAADRLLAGASTSSIVNDWDARGIRTPTGRPWLVSSIRRMLMAPRIAGFRSHHGVVVGSGHIPAILDPETHTRLVAVLTTRRGRVIPQGRTYLLTGLVTCGRCGNRLQAHPGANAVRRYACVKPNGCGGLAIGADDAEAFVQGRVVDALSSPALQAGLAAKAGGSVEADLDALRGYQDALAEASDDYYVKRDITKPEFFATRERLGDLIGEAQRRIEATANDSILATMPGTDLAAEWGQRDLPWRRALVEAAVVGVTVHPALRRGGRFDADRIEVEYRA